MGNPGRRWSTSEVSVLVKALPSTATPRELPSTRNSITVEVATPMSRTDDDRCTT